MFITDFYPHAVFDTKYDIVEMKKILASTDP